MAGYFVLALWFLLVDGVSGVGSVEDSVFVMEGDSVTLNTSVTTNQQERIKWYFKNTLIARISGDLSVICTDVQCRDGNERFRDRLKLDHQTGSLTITNTRNTDSGEYKLLIIKGSDSETVFNVDVHGFSAAKQDKSSMEGESVTLDPGVINPNDSMTWYFNDTVITEITGDQSQICTDVQCDERFRDRLKLDNKTGSLTITNTRNTDSGVHHLQINNSRFSIIRSSVFGVGSVEVSVSVMDGDLVTLCTGVKTNQQEKIKWFFNNTFIAHISGNLSVICTDVQCGDGNERFRDRLKLDHQTGSLTIMNITITDSGVYTVVIIKGSDSENYTAEINESDSETVFNVDVHAAERETRKSLIEGESVTLDPGVMKNTNDVMKWYFNGIRITEITGDQSKNWTDVKCGGRFRDRLKLDHQTGSLTITNTRTEHDGLYKLQINSCRFSIFRSFSVMVTVGGPNGSDDS